MDRNLKFLEKCANEELLTLTNMLVYDPKDHKERFSESLTKTKEWSRYYPNNIKGFLPLVEKEYLFYGGNSIANWFRGHGVSYKEVLYDVCKQLKVNFNKNSSVDLIESYLLQKVLIDTIDKMNEEEIKGMCGAQTKDAIKKELKSMNQKLITQLSIGLAINLAARWGVRQGVMVAGRLAAAGAGLAIPFVNAALVIWAVLDVMFSVTGPAYRVTVPATLYIASLRRVYSMME